MLVVIGIIAVLFAFALPMIFKVMRQGQRTKGAADFQTIGSALEAYKGDVGDYPRPTAANSGFCTLTYALLAPYGNGIDDANSTPGNSVLDPQDPPAYAAGKQYKAGDCVRQPSSLPPPGTVNTFVALRDTTSAPSGATDANWLQFNVNDDRDGPGSRVRAGGSPRGPYLQPEKLRVRGLAILDQWDHPVLYFPASTAKPNINATAGFLKAGNKQSMYDPDDNEIFFRRTGETDHTNSLVRIAHVLGDTNYTTTNNTNGSQIDAGETAATTGPFILWSAGPDDIYGPRTDATVDVDIRRSVDTCDDVTNFK